MRVASVSACDKIWYLHFRAVSGVTIKASTYPELAMEMHEDAAEKCVIANSLNIPVRCEAVITE
eukprot:gene9219-12458_t